MSQIPFFSSKRCNAPPFLLSILYKTSFLSHIFCFIIHAINTFLVVLNIFHTSSKLKAAIFWFSKPFHYIFLLLFRQKAARGVRKGFPQEKEAARSVREGFPQAKSGAQRARGIPAGKKRRAACERDSRRQKRRRAACERDSRRISRRPLT